MYLNWDTKIITDFSPENIEKMYDAGYVFTRVGKGIMNKTRSLRIRLSDFEMSSENRRILKKVENLKLETSPIPYKDYSWEISKLAKDFYEKHEANFSANKIKKILTDESATNFNVLLTYMYKNRHSNILQNVRMSNNALGYAICYESEKILHYSYPFYKSDSNNPSLGLGMMIMAINYAKEKGLEYIYLGSLQRPTDSYKLQFSGQEWFDGEKWTQDFTELKTILK